METEERSTDDPEERLLSPEDLVSRWNGAVTKKTLANWRSLGRGPGFIILGANPRYRLRDVEAFERANERRYGRLARAERNLEDRGPASL